MGFNALVSIHDVAPKTMARVEHIISLMPEVCKQNLILLVIPGVDWKSDDIERLKEFEARGFELAGHGWTHHCEKINGLYHKLHSTLVSRRCAEHLSLNETQILNLLKRVYTWFLQYELIPPRLYVPPAWAMGAISSVSLRNAPFRYYEFSRGIYDVTRDELKTLPLIGFEADNQFRKMSLQSWNHLNILVSSDKKPVRFSIHPYDTELLMVDSLHKRLKDITFTQDYSKVFD